MKEEIIKVFDLFIENAETSEFKELIKDIKEMYEENEKLHSIIKEVRDKTIQILGNNSLDFMYRQAYKDILEILDKGE